MEQENKLKKGKREWQAEKEVLLAKLESLKEDPHVTNLKNVKILAL